MRECKCEKMYCKHYKSDFDIFCEENMSDEFKKLQDSVGWTCRFHPTDSFHEVGCPHRTWTIEQIMSALVAKKKFEEEGIKNLNEVHRTKVHTKKI